MYSYFQSLLPMVDGCGIKRKVATPAAHKKDYSKTFIVVTVTTGRRGRRKMFRALPATTGTAPHVVPNMKPGQLESQEEILKKRCQRA